MNDLTLNTGVLTGAGGCVSGNTGNRLTEETAQ